MIMKRITLLISLLFFAGGFALKAQNYLGYSSSNYAGVHGLEVNPASIVDNRFMIDINLVSVDFSLFNNYIGLRRSLIKDARNGNVDDQGDFRDTYLFEDFDGVNGSDKNIYMNALINLPSIMVTLNSKNALAFSFKSRTTFNAENIDPALAKQAWEDLKFEELWLEPLENEDFSVQAMSWVEYGITYGRQVLWKNNHYLKAAGSVKLIQGVGSAFLYVNDLDYLFVNNDTLTLVDSDVQYGHSSNFELESDNLSYKFVGNPTLGFDLGFVYEWRKDRSEYEYDMDGKTGLLRNDKNKYKLRLGFSVLDIGRVKFDKGDLSANFTANITNWDISNFELDDVGSFNDTIQDRFGFDVDEGEYKMNLPTSISVQADYNVWKGFYVNATAFIGLRFKNDESKIRNMSSYSISPRFEHKWFGIGLPYSFTNYGDHRIGGYLRLGPLVMGTNDWRALAIEDEIYSANFYMALKVPIPYGKPKDKDKDGVSNRKDECKKVPGPWENLGCPDTDGDGINDDDDLCPTEAGPEENSGCPWSDKDGDKILDADDDCPEVPGPEDNNGCPYGDTDGDGVNDNLDLCIDVVGPAENSGCPWGDLDEDGVLDNVDKCPEEVGPADNDGCPYGDRDGDGINDKEDDCPDVKGPEENGGCPYGDADGDGVTDNLDRCPKTPGPVSNQGCPELKEEEKEAIKTAFDDLEFESSKAVIKASSYETLDALAKVLTDREDAKLKISGHTDSQGSDALNLRLSKERAEAVKKYFMDKGMADDKFIIEYFGEAKPIADNTTAAGRAENRRVEMELVFE